MVVQANPNTASFTAWKTRAAKSECSDRALLCSQLLSAYSVPRHGVFEPWRSENCESSCPELNTVGLNQGLEQRWENYSPGEPPAFKIKFYWNTSHAHSLKNYLWLLQLYRSRAEPCRVYGLKYYYLALYKSLWIPVLKESTNAHN